jgi:hypothetical protein
MRLALALVLAIVGVACRGHSSAHHGGSDIADLALAWSSDDAATTDGDLAARADLAAPADLAIAPANKHLWIVFHSSAQQRDLAGMFKCLLSRSDFNDRARGYPGGYGLAWGGQTTAACAGNDYACGVAALGKSGFTVGDHDVVELIEPGYCGGDNNARNDGVAVGNIRIRGANVGDCSGSAPEERVAVHEAFESAGHWADADCCTGEVNPAACADNGEAFCPDCPCSCDRYRADGTYGGYTLDCGGGKTWYAQRVPKNSGGEYDPNACSPFTLK